MTSSYLIKEDSNDANKIIPFSCFSLFKTALSDCPEIQSIKILEVPSFMTTEKKEENNKIIFSERFSSFLFKVQKIIENLIFYIPELVQ